ncbi:hypothetical protein IFO70_10560 [Phormidium tenue FACHB-886]|nr:hypothetical protein [Phormidium tenue FACHB-886]
MISTIVSSDDQPPMFRSSRSNREPVRLIVLISRAGVTAMTHSLYLKEVAAVDDWRDLQPKPNTGKWISVVTKYF